MEHLKGCSTNSNVVELVEITHLCYPLHIPLRLFSPSLPRRLFFSPTRHLFSSSSDRGTGRRRCKPPRRPGRWRSAVMPDRFLHLRLLRFPPRINTEETLGLASVLRRLQAVAQPAMKALGRPEVCRVSARRGLKASARTPVNGKASARLAFMAWAWTPASTSRERLTASTSRETWPKLHSVRHRHPVVADVATKNQGMMRYIFLLSRISYMCCLSKFQQCYGESWIG